MSGHSSTHPTPVTGNQELHCLDMFGASGVVAREFRAAGFAAKSLDYLLGGDGDQDSQDILTQVGWYNYLDHLMAMPLGFV